MRTLPAKLRKYAAASCVLAFSVAGAGPAAAQTTSPGFALDRFDPSSRGSEWFAVDSLDLRGHLRPVVGLVLDGAYRPLAIYDAGGSLRTAIVDGQVFAHLGGALVLFERLRLNLNLPIALYSGGSAGTLGGTTYAAPTGAAAGDLRLAADVLLVGKHGDVFTLAGGLQLFVPTGSRDAYTGDGSARVEPRLLAAGEVGSFAWAARASTQIRTLSESFGGGSLGSELSFGGSVGVRLADRKLLVGPEIFGSTVFDDAFAKRATPLEGLLGAHYSVTDEWRVGLGGGAGLTRGFGSPVARGVAVIEWVPAERKEPPPKKVEPPPPPPKKVEPPPPPPDKDGDGVIDAEDACVDVKGVRTADKATNGCPPDKDGDGIPDADDVCPDKPGPKTADPKTNGCPPDPDRDKDGIPNEQDACPDEPGKPDPDPKRNGCPKAFVQQGQIKILDQVKFASASAAILPTKDSQEILEAVLKVLKEHPEITKVRVEGHTDNQGAAAYNKDLSARRAAAVVEWLVKHGIDRGRLVSEGFGLERPIDRNDNEAGRKNNRRVEFHIVDQKQ